MLRELRYEVTLDGVTPNTTQIGGLQYEDNATDVVFVINQELEDKLADMCMQQDANLLYRIDFNSSAGGYDPSENLNNLRRSIPYKFTYSGGAMTATLVITSVDYNNEYLSTILSHSVFIEFEPVKRNEASAEMVVKNISALEEKLRQDLEDGKFQGEKGEDGKDYILTEADKEEIANIVKQDVDTSEYEEELKLLFKNGDVRILNGTTAGSGEITISQESANESGDNYVSIKNNEIDVRHLATQNGTKIKPNLLEMMSTDDYGQYHSFEMTSQYIKKEKKQLTWDKLFNAVESIENLVNVSEVGQ